MAIINGTPFNDSLNGTAGFDEINGLAGDDILNGLGGRNVLNGGDGVDTLISGAETDSLYGGDGIDTASYSTATAGVTVNLNFQRLQQVTGGGGADRLESIENLTGSNFNDRLIGNSGDNVLSGLDGDDVLIGGLGNDQLLGGNGGDALSGDDGNDVLNGGAGIDTMDGGAGNDTYIVDNPFDVVNDPTFLGGIDTVQSSVTYSIDRTFIDRLTLTGTAAIDGIGNGLDNILTGNGATNLLWGQTGNDTLNGGGGTDQLFGGLGNDVLNGGTGADIMVGDTGNDIYIVDHVNDKTVEGPMGGRDHVQASVSHTLGEDVEDLTLTGSSAINGTGNALNNILTGNSANNVLSGLDGNDTLIGNSGNDTLNGGNGNDVLRGGSGQDLLNGGAGNDRFDYNAVSESPTSTGRDVITGFAGAGTALGDQIDLRDIDANVLAAGNQAFTWKGATPGGAGTLWYSGGMLYGNIDGDATPEFQIQLVGSPALSVGGTGTDILL